MTTFISYSRDNSNFVFRFARDLRAAGFDIWLDQLDIPKGSRWDDEVERALESSSTFIIVLSPESIESQNVKDEIGYAIDNGKHILPVLLKPCKIPFRLRRFQFVDFTDKSYDESLAEIKHLLSNTKELATGTGDEENFQQPSSIRSTDQGISARTPQEVETVQPVVVRQHRKWDTQVIIALIGLAGTIIVALLGSPWFENWFATGSLPTTVSTTATGNDQISNTQEATIANTASPVTPTVNPVLTSTEEIPATLYPRETIYSFIDDMCDASWFSGAGQLPCPGTDGDANGFVLKVSNSRFESGALDSRPGLLISPQNRPDGYIQGVFPPLTIQNGDYFRVTMSCEDGATSCYLAYRLDYRLASGTTHTLGTFLEEYDYLKHDASVDLSSLAGQSVQFILTILSYGSPSGDRALWIDPRIVNASCKNSAEFIQDVTVIDETLFSPGEKFRKTTRIKNSGTCTWTNDYFLVFISGEDMKGPHRIGFPSNVEPGQIVDISLNLEAPLVPGSYRGYWMLLDPSGGMFGDGLRADKPWWVDIKVVAAPTSTP